MTREEYLKIYTDASYARVVNQIFNDLEAQLKAKNDHIVELNKKEWDGICKECVNYQYDGVFSPCEICSRHFSDHYEQKEQ